MNHMLNAALAYAKMGWRVFPVKPRAKTPLVPAWPQEATTDERRITAWWRQWPDANIGLATGPESGILVLDVDSREGAEATKGKELPPTPTQRTGGGGWQWLFRWDERLDAFPTTKVRVLPGVDTRGAGGYVVLPPSVHPSGRRYAWADGMKPNEVDLAPVPQWLVDLLAAEKPKAKATEPAPRILEGQRNSTLTSIAGRLRRWGLTATEIEATLAAINRERCVPPLPDDEVSRIAYSVARYEPERALVAAGRIHDEDEEPIQVLDLREAQQRYEEYVALLREAKVTLGIPVLDNAMRGLAPGETLWIIARAGVGKTALLLNILGYNSVEGVDSLFCSLEMPIAQVYERLVQIGAEQAGRDVEQVFIKAIAAREAGRQLPPEHTQWTEATWRRFQHVRFADKDSMSMEDVRRAVAAYVQRYGKLPRIVAIDYLGRMDGGSGSNYEVTSRLAKQTKSLAKALNVAVIVIHQVSREGGDGSQEVTLNMARDSGQVEEAADFVLGLWRPELREAISQRSDTETVEAALLKCRRGPLRRTSFVFDKVRMIFRAPDSTDGTSKPTWTPWASQFKEASA